MKLTDIFDVAIGEATALYSLYRSDSAKTALPSEVSPAIFLRASLVYAMAAVDKILHEAISKKFAGLSKDGSLDGLVELEVSKVYRIALAARERTGRGGRKRRRPGHDIKTEVLQKIYRDSYLATRNLEQVCGACGKNKIFTKFAASRKRDEQPKQLQSRWSRIYYRRNQVAHECDIQRKERMRKVTFNPVDDQAIKRDIRFIKNFGRFLARELD